MSSDRYTTNVLLTALESEETLEKRASLVYLSQEHAAKLAFFKGWTRGLSKLLWHNKKLPRSVREAIADEIGDLHEALGKVVQAMATETGIALPAIEGARCPTSARFAGADARMCEGSGPGLSVNGASIARRSRG